MEDDYFLPIYIYLGIVGGRWNTLYAGWKKSFNPCSLSKDPHKWDFLLDGLKGIIKKLLINHCSFAEIPVPEFSLSQAAY